MPACSCIQDESLQAGDYIVVHLGYAIQKTTAQEARTAWELYDQMLEGGYA
jgi:hydrogenase expression/formation protein HypC